MPARTSDFVLAWTSDSTRVVTSDVVTALTTSNSASTSDYSQAQLVYHNYGCRQQLFIPAFTSRSFAHSLTQLQEGTIRKALGPGTADEVMIKGYGITLRRQDMWTLNNCRWLNDQVKWLIVIIKF